MLALKWRPTRHCMDVSVELLYVGRKSVTEVFWDQTWYKRLPRRS
ncbi:hypothetical protein A2U01_0106439, partial [Trifolium medium]|nr:hypothetical protein [Trifolium medium]